MPYLPPRWLPNRHLMTIFGNVARLPIRLAVRRERWELPDGDFLDVDRLDGKTADAPLVIVCHGLEGSSRAGYVRGLLSELQARGFGAVALNFRGCSGELNRLPRFYHSGETGDLAYAVDKLAAERPARRIGLCGFSLGGNVVAKYLGERGAGAPALVRAAVVVSVPFDLAGCARALDGPGLPAFIYRGRFLRRLKPKALAKAARFAGLVDVAQVRRARSMHAFDDAVTAPIHGFADAEEYWARASSAGFLPGVQRPLLILQSADDPFVPPETLPLAAVRANPLVELELSPAGGHVAFVAGPPWWPHRFAERRAASWLAAQLS